MLFSAADLLAARLGGRHIALLLGRLSLLEQTLQVIAHFLRIKTRGGRRGGGLGRCVHGATLSPVLKHCRSNPAKASAKDAQALPTRGGNGPPQALAQITRYAPQTENFLLPKMQRAKPVAMALCITNCHHSDHPDALPSAEERRSIYPGTNPRPRAARPARAMLATEKSPGARQAPGLCAGWMRRPQRPRANPHRNATAAYFARFMNSAGLSDSPRPVPSTRGTWLATLPDDTPIITVLTGTTPTVPLASTVSSNTVQTLLTPA